MELDKDLQALIQREFVTEDNIEAVESRLRDAIRLGLEFKARDQVVNYKPISELKELICQDIPENGQPYDEVLKEFEDRILKHATNFGSRNFMAFPDSGNAVSALTGAFMLNLMNQNLINSKHCAPTASMVEVNVIQWLRELVGYDVKKDTDSIFDVGGVVVTGGVLANSTAMLLARENRFPGTKDRGVTFDPSRVKVIIPEFVEHYSIRASLGWIGLGEQNVLRVKSKDFKIDLEDLQQKIDENEGVNDIMAIVAYAGDSRSMTIDNFEAISEIAKKHDIWFHIDACHGLQYAFSEKLKPKLGPISLADSITVDPHKIMFLPYNLSAVLVKEPEKFKSIAGTSDLIMKEDHAFGQITPFIGSKAFWSLKLWFMWKTLGQKNIGRLIEYRHGLAEHLNDKLQQDDDFEVLNKEVNINSVVFMYLPTGYNKEDFDTEQKIQQLNALNAKVQDTLFCNGEYYVHTFSIPDLGNVMGTGQAMLQPMRYMCGNPVTKPEDIDNMVEAVRAIGKELEHEFFTIQPVASPGFDNEGLSF